MWRVLIGLVVVFVGNARGVGQAQAQEKPAKEKRYALLVGCTRYPNLKADFQLKGPANDVLLMRDLLVGRFAFPKDNVTVLSETSGGEEQRPTRSNIEREFKRLARIARPGDKVVILLAGHGSQQPVEDPDDPENYEPDGLDEIFLPADVGEWDGNKGKIANAIVDNEFRSWLKQIQKQRSSIWVIVDTCNAGTMIRGVTDDEVQRGIPAEQLIPTGVLEAARKKAARQASKSRGSAENSRFHFQDTAPDLVAIYAVRSGESTIEWTFPRTSAERKPYGLLTYTLTEVLTQTDVPLTYVELTQQIHDRYVQMDKGRYTPLVEGKDRHQEVLGVHGWPERSRMLLAATEDGFKVTAGALHGLTPGCILAVHPPAGKKNGEKAVGHVRVEKVRMIEALVVPCTFKNFPEVDKLPVGGRCSVVHRDFGLDRLKVALAVNEKRDPTLQRRLHEELEQLAAKKGALLQLTTPEQADWLVQASANRVNLISASEWKTRGGRPSSTDAHIGKEIDAETGAWLEDRLQRIHRARNLLKITGVSRDEMTRGGTGVDIDVQVIHHKDETDREGKVVRWDQAGIQFKKGDIIGFKLHNRSRFPVDVTLLFVDADFGIEPFFPQRNTTGENRLNFNETIRTPRAKINAKTIGLEHMVVIAVKADNLPVDFTCLAQPSLERARGVATRGGQEERTLDSPLGQLFQTGLFGQGATRGISTSAFEEYALRLVSWHSVSNARD